MPSSKRRRRSGHGEIMPPSSKLDVIDRCLKTQTETFPKKDLSPEEVQRWHRDVGSYPVEAIEWAFENWRKNGHFFPVPSDILEQIQSWAPTTGASLCDRECKRRHGKGYGEADMLWLWKKRSVMQGDLDDAGWAELFRELDAKREGGAPEWSR